MSIDSTTSDLPTQAYVIWEDATAEAEWKEFSEFGTDTCHALGFVIQEDSEHISLAATVSEDKANAVISIPKGMIYSLTYFPKGLLPSLSACSQVSDQASSQ